MSDEEPELTETEVADVRMALAIAALPAKRIARIVHGIEWAANLNWMLLRSELPAIVDVFAGLQPADLGTDNDIVNAVSALPGDRPRELLMLLAVLIERFPKNRRRSFFSEWQMLAWERRPGSSHDGRRTKSQ